MSINFDLSNADQSTIYFKNLKTSALDTLISFSQRHTSIARFIGLPIGLCASLLEIAKAVSVMGEPLIKGVINIFGSPFTQKCKFSIGIRQIFIDFLIKGAIISGIMTSLKIAAYILVFPIEMLINPIARLQAHRKAVDDL